MFPLGSVLFPHMPLPLRVFEQRYLTMLSRILPDDTAEFGVVLIERGQEVGGGERRFTVGTVAQIEQLDATAEFVVLVARGVRRIEVLEWLDENPHPVARVRELPDLDWSDDLFPLRERAEAATRSALRLAAEFGDPPWSPDVEIAADPVAAAWQLAAIAPVGPLDQLDLLRSESMESLLTRVIDLASAAEETLRTRWADD